MKIIAHIDLNAFFVRAEEIKNPQLENKPVAIGSDGRAGIVSTCSYKAREYGVRSGMPMFAAKELCKDLIIIHPDFTFYTLLSNEFMTYISQFSNKIEQFSIDECFVDFTDYYLKTKDNKLFEKVRDGLYEKTSLKCSIGVANTKFLAKMGSDVKKPMGITIITSKNIKNVLFNNDIGTYFGIGKQTAPKLKKIGINTIGDLYYGIKNNNEKLMKMMGKFAPSIINELEGKSDDEVIQKEEKPDSISCRTTLPYNMDNENELLPYLKETIATVLRKFEKTNLFAQGVEVAFRYTNLKTKTFSRKLDFPTKNVETIESEILKIFDNSFKGETLRQIGCAVERLINGFDDPIQTTLFNYESFEKEDPANDVINNINRYLDNSSSKLFRASDLLKKDGD